MSKLIEIIKAFQESQQDVIFIIPGRGETISKVESIDDDVVTINAGEDFRMVVHYSNIIIKRD